MEKALQACGDTITQMIGQFLGGQSNHKHTQITPALSNLKKMLLQHDLAYELVIPAQSLNCHFQTRHGIGVDSDAVHKLLNMILSIGFDIEKTRESVCFEVSKDPSKFKKQVEFNKTLATSSSGGLADVNPADCKYLTVAGSHTLQLLRKPCTEGYTWFVIRAEVEEAFPELPTLFVEGGNADHGTSTTQSKIQALLQVHGMGQRNLLSCQSYKWKEIEQAMEKTKPHLRGQVGDMIEFLKVYSGGDNAPLLQDVAAYAKCVGDKMRDVHGTTFKMLSQVPFLQGPTFIGACVKACMVCPAQYVKNGVSKLISSSDFSSLSQPASKLKADALEICTATEVAEAWLSKVPGIDPGVSARLIGDMQVISIMTCLKKKSKSTKNYETLKEVHAQFMVDARAAQPQCMEVKPTPFEAEAEEDINERRAASAGVVQFSKGGTLSDRVMQNNGLVVGKRVWHKTDHKTVRVIQNLESGKATLVSHEWWDEDMRRRKQKTSSTPLEKMELVVSFGCVVDEWE
ncbi:unnamed protein product, partial [Prorocentrum cordatum]